MNVETYSEWLFPWDLSETAKKVEKKMRRLHLFFPFALLSTSHTFTYLCESRDLGYGVNWNSCV
jgi:hypothetical protein